MDKMNDMVKAGQLNQVAAAATATASRIRKSFFGAQVCLRAMAIMASLGAVAVMLTSAQSAVVYGIPFKAEYTYSSAFRFNLFAEGIACSCCMVSLFLLISLGRQSWSSPNYFVLFLHDLAMTVVVVAGSGAATGVALVGKYGNKHTGWMPICDHFAIFCGKISISISLSLLSAVLLLMLTVLSGYTTTRTCSICTSSSGLEPDHHKLESDWDLVQDHQKPKQAF